MAPESWRELLGSTFGQMTPEPVDGRPPLGRIAGGPLGALLTYQVSGTPQVVLRSPGAVRRVPNDLLKICVPLTGHATVCQDDREIPIGPGEMAIYDTGRPYHLRLEQQWTCAVIAFPRAALHLPAQVVLASMAHAWALDGGPGAVLASFVAAAVGQRDAMAGPSADRLGEAGLHLVAGTLTEAATPAGEEAADAQRLQVLEYVRSHLADPGLTHARVAAAHHMASRTLHRLFEHEPCTVTDHIRAWRLEAARRDLTDPLLSHRSIATIAAHWCFPGQAHFTRAFHARYGQNPSDARRALPSIHHTQSYDKSVLNHHDQVN
jgi:AraC-like DNA-binding protein